MTVTEALPQACVQQELSEALCSILLSAHSKARVALHLMKHVVWRDDICHVHTRCNILREKSSERSFYDAWVRHGCEQVSSQGFAVEDALQHCIQIAGVP